MVRQSLGLEQPVITCLFCIAWPSNAQQLIKRLISRGEESPSIAGAGQ